MTSRATEKTGSVSGLRGVIYARYSDGGNQTDQSLEGQVRECRKYADDNGIIIVQEYLDPHISGKGAENRPAFQQMIADGDKHQFEVVIVWKTDRFARNRYDSARYKERLRRNGISIRYAAEHIPDSAEGIILESMLEGMAEYYSADLRQKILRGMRESAYKCKVLTRAPIGYKPGPNREYLIDEETAPVVRQIFQKYVDGERLSDIAEFANAMGLRTGVNHRLTITAISAIVSNQKYIGVYEYKNGEIRVENGIPPIIDKSLFYAAQRRRESRKKGDYSRKNMGRPAKREYLLSGLVFCGDCGSSMFGETSVKTHAGGRRAYHAYYSCKAHREKTGPGCPNSSIQQEPLEELVKDVLIDVILNDSLRQFVHSYILEASASQVYKDRIKAIKRQIKSKESAISNLIDTLEKGVYSNSLIERLKALEKEISYLEAEIAANKEMDNQTAKRIDWVFDNIQRKANLSDADWRNLVSAFVKSVTCYSNGNVEVCLNFYNHPTPGNHYLGIKVQKSINDYLVNRRTKKVREMGCSLHSQISTGNSGFPVLFFSICNFGAGKVSLHKLTKNARSPVSPHTTPYCHKNQAHIGRQISLRLLPFAGFSKRRSGSCSTRSSLFCAPSAGWCRARTRTGPPQGVNPPARGRRNPPHFPALFFRPG